MYPAEPKDRRRAPGIMLSFFGLSAAAAIEDRDDRFGRSYMDMILHVW